MEEKERYYYKEYAGDYDILDRNDKNAYYGAISRDEEDAQNLINLLNKQDREIKRLAQENQQLREDLQAKDILVNTYMSVVGTLDNAKQLKQSQKQLAISELGKLKSLLEKESKENPIVYDINNDSVSGAIDKDTCFYIINNQIKELKGEE